VKATVTTMASAKGGSGKTMITAVFGTILAALGKRVLMVDTDAATNGLSLFFLDSITEETSETSLRPRGLFESSRGDSLHFLEILPNLLFLPATYGLNNTESVDIHTHKTVLRELVSRYRSDFDFIFLDAQAGSDEFAEAAISQDVSDQVIIVSEYDPMSAAGVERLKAIFPSDLGFQRTWVLLNKMLPEFIKSFNDFMEVARYLSPLPWNADVVRAYARKELPLDLEAGNEYTLAAIHTLRSVLPPATRRELDAWLDARSSELRSPIKTQLENAREELAILRERRMLMKKRRRYFETFILIAATLIGVAAGLLNYFIGTGSVGSRLTFATACILAGFSIGTTIMRRVRGLFPSSSEDYDDIEDDIQYAADRVRRLSELSDSEFEQLVRGRNRSTN
jgi:cellulose biosynthesis protein BcsQ